MARVWIARKTTLLAAKVGLIYSFTNSNLIRGSVDVTAPSPIALMERTFMASLVAAEGTQNSLSVYLAALLGEARTEGCMEAVAICQSAAAERKLPMFRDMLIPQG
jgi:hypothetical protein